MKFKHFLLALLLIASYTNIAAQTQKPLYEITFYKIEHTKGSTVKKFVLIDSSGNLYDRDDKLLASFDIKQLTKEVNNYITKEKIEKSDANNEPPPPAITPGVNKQAIHIIITFKDDVDKEAEFRNKTSYMWAMELPKTMNDYVLYKYLSPKEVAILKQELK